MASILITGVSTGIGNALARYHLARGDEVLAVSRNPAANIPPQEHFHFMRCDLTDIERAPAILQTLLSRTPAPVETVYLNAGRFGGAPQLATQTSMQEFNSVLALNLGAVKMVLDCCR
ncbi:SDR family NAD(P)-dependent oxidoreductase [Pseudomonas sp. G11]|uniref:SDR family NAD(P)-dependent oxidoreductase n=1 Tax=Pseudomonas sp. G11 TaxID=528343 RepID=UPI0024027DED|nr:SDR family NAD(P)-dependent oxidoreductase [Pseudomonas sp. G11]WEX15965.1 SDR family NAD(P)-dependent oxidoreductase [Pseudomonas sp. G11]